MKNEFDPFHVNYEAQARAYSVPGYCPSFYELVFSAGEFASLKIPLYSKALAADASKNAHQMLLFSPTA